MGQILRLVRREEVSGLAIADQLAMSADIRCDDDALLRHCLQRLQRRHKLGEPQRDARKDEQVG